MAKCAVTGGAGFIGSHLVEGLVNRGHEVLVVDDFSSGRMENLAGVELGGAVRLLRLDISVPGALDGVFDGVRWVFHHAAVPSVSRSVDDPCGTNQINATGTLHVLEGARRAGVEKVMFATSCSVYGDSEELPKREEMPATPLSPYALQKYVGELYCRMFSDLYGIPTMALRYFNVFGPRQDPKSEYAAVIPRFITRMLAGQAPIIYGDGEQTRDFIYVDNVVDANLKAAESAASGTVLNIGLGRRVSLNEIVDLLNSILKTSIQPEYQDAKRGEVRHSVADIRAAKEKMGFVPGVDFCEGLKRSVMWYRQRGNS
ncbi:MAG: SDR family oxidoreductase [Acidobacteriota bacterium]